jgi:peroxiredoxin
MRFNWLRIVFLAGCVVPMLGSEGVLLTGAEKASPALGKKIDSFSLPDTRNQRVGLEDFKDKKALAVIFIGTECPINNAFMPRLIELHKSFAQRGVQFLAINANQQDTPERVAEHARKHGLPFPVLKDKGNVVADLFGAQRTPEAFVLDGERKIRYQGRIDDQFGVGYQRPRPTRRDLAMALDEVLEGKPVSQPTTAVAGCIISRVTSPKNEGRVTFNNQVVRILQKNCQECHRPGQIGPMPLLTYDDAVAWSETLREVVEDRRMPPWYADPHYGKFSNDRSLPPADRETLLSWVGQGCPRGDDKDLPPPREFVPGWTIGKPDVIFTMKEPYEVPAVAPKNGIEYQNFEVETNFLEDKWVERAEAKAGAAAVVHHIVVFIVAPGHKFVPKEGNAPLLCGTAPGDMPLILRPGTAKKIPAGSKLVFQMHYTANGTAQKDRSCVGLIFAREQPKRQVFSVAVANLGIRIPPGADNYERESSFTFRNNAHILGFMPHMHLRGKDIRAEVISPDGKKETVLSVPRYNFGWQSAYRLEEPLPMPKGSRIHFIAHFDNSSKNPNNPDPTKEVRWGDQTWEEMLIGWTDVAFDLPPQGTATKKD